MKRPFTKPNQTEIIQLKNQLARALADYDNLRKRIDRERQDFEKYANIKLALRLLPVLDVLKQAQGHLKDPGIAITVSEFENALKEEGIEEIKAKKGEGFNPQFEEAVDMVPGGKKGTVADEVLSGWKFADGRVIRAAKVRVYGEKSKKEEELEKEAVRGDYV
jgi:molecular chaperone GrpE